MFARCRKAVKIGGMIRSFIRFIRSHASLTMIVGGAFMSLIGPLSFTYIAIIVALEPHRMPSWVSGVFRYSIGIGAVILLAGILLGLWQGVRNRGRIS